MSCKSLCNVKVLAAAVAAAVALSGVLLGPATVSAADYTAVQQGDWSDSATWGGGGYPVLGDTATINGNGWSNNDPTAYPADYYVINVALANAVADTLNVNNWGVVDVAAGRQLMVGTINMGIADNERGFICGDGTLMINSSKSLNINLSTWSIVGLAQGYDSSGHGGWYPIRNNLTVADYDPGTGPQASSVIINGRGGAMSWGGNNSYSGGTTINVANYDQYLELGPQTSTCFGTGPVTLNGTNEPYGLRIIGLGGQTNQLNVNGGAMLWALEWNGPIQLVASDSVLWARDVNLNGKISGPGILTAHGGTAEITNADNDYTGNTTVVTGTLRIGGAGRLNGGNYAGEISMTNAGGSAIFEYASSADQVLSGQISGDGGVTKSGSGNLTLSGANTYTGLTTVTNGTLYLGATGSISNSTQISLADTTTLNVSAVADYHLAGGQTLTGSGNLNVAGKMTVDGGATVEPGGPSTGSVGSLTVGSLTLGADSVIKFKFNGDPANDLVNVTETDGLVINGGKVGLYQSGSTDPFSSLGNYNLFQYAGADPVATNLSVLNPISGRRYGFSTASPYVVLTIGAGPTWTGLGADDNWSTVDNWTNGPIQTGDQLIFDGSTRLSNVNDVAQPVTQLSSLVFKPTAGDGVNGFTLNGKAVTLNGDGDGYLIRNDTPTVTHTINLPITVGAAGKSITTSEASGTTVLGGAINNNGHTVTFNGAGNTTISATGTLSGGGGLTKDGAGTLAVNAATTYSGDTRAIAGTIRIGHSLALQQTTVDMKGSDAGTLDLNGIDATLGGLKGSRNVTIPTNKTLSVGNNDTSTLYSGVISGDGNLTKVGGGTLTISGTQTYTGATAITGGKLQLKGTPAGPPVAGYAHWFDASSLSLGDGDPVTAWNSGGSIGGTATVPGGNQNPTYVANAGTETGLGAVHFNAGGGAGDSGALGFTRDTDVRTIISVFKGCSFLATDSSEYKLHRPSDDDPASALLADWGQINYLGSVHVNGDLVNDPMNDAMPTGLHNGFNIVSVVTNGTPIELDSFNKDREFHSGDQSQAEVILYDTVLSDEDRQAVEAYLNAKWFGIGTLGGSGSDLLPTGTQMSISLGAAFDMNGVNQQLASLSGAGTVTNDGTGDVTLKLSSGVTLPTPNFSGAITDGATNKISLLKDGLGTQILSGASTYSGGTTVTAGTLLVANTTGSATGSGPVGVAVAGTLAGTGSITGLVTSAGTVAPGTESTPGTLSLKGGLTLGDGSILAMRISSTAGDLIDLVSSELNASGTTTINLTDAGVTGAGFFTLIGNVSGGTWSKTNFSIPATFAGYDANLDDSTGTSLRLLLTSSGPGEWKGAGGGGANSGDWNVAGNWTAGVPNGNTATARLWTGITANAAVDLQSTDQTVKSLSFKAGSPSGNYTLQASGSGTLHMAADSGSATIEVQSGAHTITAGVSLDSNTDVKVTDPAASLALNGAVSGAGSLTLPVANTGTVKLGGNNYAAGYSGGTTVNGGTLQLDQAGALREGSSLTINTANVALGGATTVNLGNAVKLGDLNINGHATSGLTASLDLNKSKLIADKTLVSVAVIRAQIKNAYAGGLWTGAGITSGAAAADRALNGTTAKTGVGYLDNSISAFQGGSKTTWQGRSVDSNSVLVRYTYYGDANLDGAVNLADFGLLKANYGTGTHWYQGDFDYSGTVNLADFGKLTAAYGSTPIAAGAAVPEPSILALLLTGGALVGARFLRRRK